jgi:hypothetical protein
MIERIAHRKDKRGQYFHHTKKRCPPGCWFIYEHHYQSDTGPKTVVYFDFTCPCGCGQGGPIPIVDCKPELKPERCWAWNGNREAPTLYPSILCSGQKCKWHGFFENGGWRSNGDGAPTHANCVHRIS